MKSFEHIKETKIIWNDDSHFNESEYMDKMGNEGWELAHIEKEKNMVNAKYSFYWKREKQLNENHVANENPLD